MARLAKLQIRQFYLFFFKLSSGIFAVTSNHAVLKLGLHVTLLTRGNEEAAADVPFARLHCTQEKRITHE